MQGLIEWLAYVETQLYFFVCSKPPKKSIYGILYLKWFIFADNTTS